MNNLFFLANESKETIKTFWEVFVNTDELVGLSINIILLLGSWICGIHICNEIPRLQ